MRVGKGGRPAPLVFPNCPETPFNGPLTCPGYLNSTSGSSGHGSTLSFDFEAFKSVPSSPWSSMAPQTPSLNEVLQAWNTIHLFQHHQNLETAFSHSANFSVLQQNLPQPQSNKMPEVSRKVFVGGLPVDGDKQVIEHVFSRFGNVVVDWPRSSGDTSAPNNTSGYVFLVYKQMESVQQLLRSCDIKDGRFFFSFGIGKAQIRPWYINDCVYADDFTADVDIRNTVFVGGVPRPATAEQLFKLLSRFGQVVFASIDCCPELQYPKGAGRVIFAEHSSFLKAIQHRFVKMNMLECHKKDIEIKPYVVQSQLCDQCEKHVSEMFCSDISCLQYYCRNCFDCHHSVPLRKNHRVVIREGERTREMNGFSKSLEQCMDNLESMNI